jgi:alkanesulfonate monooxygenase SsuD/methylene tetrahydromethanopterin reductase-like flavin-dependent oxidoreductase (luciferase family)
VFRSSRESRTVDLSTCFLGLPLDLSKEIAARTAEATFDGSDGSHLDEQRCTALRRALAAALPRGSATQVAALAHAIVGTTHMLAAARWREVDGGRPAIPEVDVASLRGALLIHLHGSPDSPAAGILRRQYSAQARVYPATRRRIPRPTRDQMLRFALEQRERERAIQEYLANLERQP